MKPNARIASNFVFIAIFLIFSPMGCKPKNQADIYGTYIADYKIANEELTLNKDGKFEQKVMLKSTSKTDIAKGAWTYDPASGYITFHEDFMVVLNGAGELEPDYANPKPGLVVGPVEKYFGRVQIGSDEGILYKKQ